MILPSRRFRNFRGVALLLSLLVVALGAIVLLGWAFDIAALKSVFPGLATMKANTALGMLLCGGALALLSREKAAMPVHFWAMGMTVVVIALAALTLSEDITGRDLGIDQALFRDEVSPVKTSSPGRPSPSTAFCFMLAGSALLVALQPLRKKWRLPVLAALAAAVMTIAGLALTGYVSDALLQAHLWNYTGIAVHTAAGFLLLGWGLLALAQSEGGLTWALDTQTTVGFVIGIVSLLAATGLSYNFTNHLFESAKWVGHTQETLKEIEEVRAGMADLESGQRGYIIIGDEHLLAQREEFKAAVREDLDALRRLTADNPRQQHLLGELEPLIASRTDFGEQTIIARRERGFSAAGQMLATGTGIRLSENINHHLQEMRGDAYAMLLQRQKESSAASTTTFLLLPLGVYLSLTILSLEFFSLNSGVGEQKQAEEKLRASLKEVTDLRDALDEHAIVAITDPQGRINYVNDKFCAISKYSSEELLGRDHRIINSGYHPKEFIRDLWTTISHGKVWHGEIRNRAKDGSIYWVDTTIVPFLNEQGKPRQYVAIRADITERKRAEETLRRQAAIIDLSPDAIIVRDLDGRIISWSRGAEILYGWTKEEILGRVTHSLFQTRFSEPLEKIMEQFEKTGRWSGELVHRTKDGREVDVQSWWLAEFSALGKRTGMLESNIDITERKRAEREIRDLNTRLEQRVVERTSELEAANKELEAFSYSVSHDLRAPLRAVDGFAQAVLEDYGPQLPEEGQRYLQTIREGAQRMGVLIDDLLTFSRLSRTPLNRQEVNTGKLVQDVLEGMNSQREGRQVDIRIGDLPACQGDLALLNQVWVNLLSNALKYTRQRQPAVIEIGCRPEQGENVYFVRDNGAGFDMRYAHKLFGVFQRLHRADEFEGTGVGLAIVQRVIHRHGGRIWADAAPDRGATFYFTLKERTPS